MHAAIPILVLMVILCSTDTAAEAQIRVGYVSDTDTYRIRCGYVSKEYPKKINRDNYDTRADTYQTILAHYWIRNGPLAAQLT
jgi:hypothetical protein